MSDHNELQAKNSHLYNRILKVYTQSSKNQMQIFNGIQNQVNLFQITAKEHSSAKQRATSHSQMERVQTEPNVEIDTQQPYVQATGSKEKFSSVMFNRLNNSSLSFRVD